MKFHLRPSPKRLGKRIADRRKALAWTQDQLAERIGVDAETISRFERGVTGSFSPGMRIDAALVANTSWLRAILWSFVFALREETLQAIGFNPLPLVVLDDPQGTFDSRNKRRWAQELVRCANMPITDMLGSQLIVTTHERNFYQMMIDHEKFIAKQGLIGGVNKISGVATRDRRATLGEPPAHCLADATRSAGYHRYLPFVRARHAPVSSIE